MHHILKYKVYYFFLGTPASSQTIQNASTYTTLVSLQRGRWRSTGAAVYNSNVEVIHSPLCTSASCAGHSENKGMDRSRHNERVISSTSDLSPRKTALKVRLERYTLNTINGELKHSHGCLGINCMADPRLTSDCGPIGNLYIILGQGKSSLAHGGDASEAVGDRVRILGSKACSPTIRIAHGPRAWK